MFRMLTIADGYTFACFAWCRQPGNGEGRPVAAMRPESAWRVTWLA